LLKEFEQSKGFKGLSWQKRRELKGIIKDKSHISGWKKFGTFINDTANLYVIMSLVKTYGPHLSPWLREMFDFLLN